MNISSNTWHYRVFSWALKEKHGYIPWQIEEQGYNLCPYVRKVLIWAPLRFMFNTTWTRLVVSVLSLVGLRTILERRRETYRVLPSSQAAVCRCRTSSSRTTKRFFKP